MCRACGKNAAAPRSRAECCSDLCAKRFSYVYRIAYANCGCCSKALVVHDKEAAATKNGRSVYCSQTCRAQAEAESNRKSWRKNYERAKRNARKHSAVRRARLRGAAVENFTHEQVFDRDGWQCHLCGGAIDPTARKPSPHAAELDHVVPLSKGGSHTLANVAAAHARCNKAKHNRLVSFFWNGTTTQTPPSAHFPPRAFGRAGG